MPAPSRFKRKNVASTWLLSFTDVVSLMLTFFVLIFSMSEPITERFGEVMGALSSTFHAMTGSPKSSGVETQKKNIESIETEQGLNLDYLASLIQNQLAQSKGLETVFVSRFDDRIVVSLPDTVIFPSGASGMGQSGQDALYNIAQSLKRIKNRIEVYGHTDKSPINREAFPSNWELSLWRSQNVANHLYKYGYERDILVQAVADNAYDDLPSDLPEAVKNQLARRVDIVIQSDTW